MPTYSAANHEILAPRGNECSILDFTSQGIQKIDIIPNAAPVIVIYDKNGIRKIEKLECYQQLEQLSLAENQLMSMTGVAQLTELTVLNLPNNNLQTIEGLKNLTKLHWLNLSDNNVKTIENLQWLESLQHLDLSDNLITHLGDLSEVKQLKTLLLHGNQLSTLRTAPNHLPPSLSIVSLAENNLTDLNEVSHLVGLACLEQLSLMNNPCVVQASASITYDYRSFVVNWCMNLRVLDGYLVTEKEGLKAEWLYSQGRGRSFHAGQHLQLIQYLSAVCPLTNTNAQSEDYKLTRVLQQQRVHQQQLQQEGTPPHQSRVGAGRPSLSPGAAQDRPSPGPARDRPTQSPGPTRDRPTQSPGPARDRPTPSPGQARDRPTPSPVRTESPRGSPRMSGRRGSRESPSSETSHSHDVGPASVYSSRYKGSPYRAWPSSRSSSADPGSRPSTAPSAVERSHYHSQPHHPYYGRNKHDMQLQDIHSSDEASSLLEAETQFLPLHSELSMSPMTPLNLGYMVTQERPRTAPTASDRPHGPSAPYAELHAHREDKRTACAAADPYRDGNPYPDVRQEHIDDRNNRPATRRIAANFSNISKSHQTSGIPPPKVHVAPGLRHPVSGTPPSSKPYSSPGSHGSSAQAEELDMEGLSTDSSQASLELKLLKALLDKRKPGRRSKRGKKSRDQSYESNNGHSDPSTPTSRPLGIDPAQRTQYTPEKYKSPTRRSRSSITADAASGEIEGAHSHGHPSAGASEERLAGLQHLEQPRVDKLTLNDPQQELRDKTLAATKLQAMWRGFIVRNRNPEVQQTRKEMRSRRSEDHIRLLHEEIDRQRQMYEHEKQLRSVQVEAMKYLWKEVQDLQKWRSGAVRSHDYQRPLPARSSVQETRITLENMPHIIESLEKGNSLLDDSHTTQAPALRDINFPIPSLSSPNPTTVLPPGVQFGDVHVSQMSQASSAQVRSSHKEAELENVCKSLQKQVTHLQDVLSSMSHLVFQGGGTSPVEKPEAGLEAIRLSTDFDQDSPGRSSQIPTQVRRQISIISPPDNAVSLAPGLPTAPVHLIAHLYNSSVVLQWQASVVLSTHGAAAQKPLLGYRVYVNGTARGMTSGSQTKSLLEGLSPTKTYRVTVRAVSALGESPDSNMLIISPENAPEGAGVTTDHSPRTDGSPGNNQRKPGPNRPDSPGEWKQDHNPPGGSQHSMADGNPGGNPGNTHDSPAQRGHSSERSHQGQARDSLLPNAPKYLLARDNSPADDSGYLTSPGNTSHRDRGKGSPGAHVFVREKSNEDMKSISETDSRTHRKSTTFERLEQSIAKDLIVGVTGVESPRIPEGLTRKLEGSKEIKQAVKTQKQKQQTPERGAPLKAIPSDPDIMDRDDYTQVFGDDYEDHKHKQSSKIPKYVGKADRNSSEDSGKVGKSDRGGSEDTVKGYRKNSWSDSSEGSRSRKSSMSESRSRQSSGNDEPKSRKGSSSDCKDSESKSTQAAKLPANWSKESRKEFLSKAPASIVRANGNSVKAKSNTIGSESVLSGPLAAKEAEPQRHTWPGEKPAEAEKETTSTRKFYSDDESYMAAMGGDSSGILVPRPPEDPGSPRKSSLSRRNSLRSRHRSGSESSREGDREVESGREGKQQGAENVISHRSSGSESDPLDPASSPDHKTKHGFVRQSRGRASVREPKKPKEVKQEKRAASVGPVLNRPQGGASVVTDKPPVARPPHTRLQEPPVVPVITGMRRRTKSEEGTTSSGENAAVQLGRGEGAKHGTEAIKGSPREKKKSSGIKISHRRSASDATGVPRIQIPEPESPRDKKSDPPTTPKQCPSSPRVRRSSSFSKALSGENPGEGVALLRQCISLETLKAAKSPDSKARMIERLTQKEEAREDDFSSGEDEPSDGSGLQKSASGPVLSGDSVDQASAKSNFRRSQSLRESKSKDKKRRDPEAAATPRYLLRASEGNTAAAAAQKPDSYSPRLSGNRREDGAKHQRKIKLGGKAAELFAKLHTKLSNKN